jgi:hypothetical protein
VSFYDRMLSFEESFEIMGLGKFRELEKKYVDV